MQRMNRWLLRGAYALAAREGIPAQAVPRLFQEESPHGKLLLFSRHFMAPQPDFPPGSHFCGFPFYDKLDPTQAELPQSLRQFLNNGASPVVFTLGTSAVMDPGAFYDEAATAMNDLGQRAVFLVGRDNLAHYQRYQSTLIHVADYAPHSLLMPRALVNVHQGGIGTTAQAIRAGRPMIVVPFSHDQPDNARRCVIRGVARTIARKHFRAPALRQALAGITTLEPAAARLGQAIRAEDGVAQACEKIAEIQASPRTI
jgi:UDP:flavonoid glycosyltransferase YjiC (YdhE family)